MEGAVTYDDSGWSTFAEFLEGSSRVLCLVGAGLSAPSGVPTWRGSNGLWNDISLRELASPQRFKDDPVTVWKFYGERMIESFSAEPNAAHLALAALARWHVGWLTINQNVDGTKISPKDWALVCGALTIFQGFLNKATTPCQCSWASMVH
jgi:NAD-dependent deacetylase sirtuin 5